VDVEKAVEEALMQEVERNQPQPQPQPVEAGSIKQHQLDRGQPLVVNTFLNRSL